MRFYPSADSMGVFLRDTSGQRKAAEQVRRRDQRMRELFAANPHPMCIYDCETLGLLAVNASALALYGYAEGEWAGLSLLDTTPREDRDAFLADPAHRGAGGSLNDEGTIWRQQRKDGSVMLVEASGSAFLYRRRKARLVKLTDVTGRLLAESGQRKARDLLQARLDQAARELALAESTLAAGRRMLARELPARLDLIRATSGTPAQGAAIQRLEHLARSMERYMALARHPVQEESLDLSALAGAVMARLLEESADRLVDVEIEPGLHCRGDRTLVAMLLEELLANAVQFTAGRSDAWVRVGRSGMPGHQEAFCVSDNGCGFDTTGGMPTFEVFGRGRAPHGHDGNGLGLAIALAVVRLHGGTIRAHSEPGQGAAFTFTLSRQPANGAHRVREVVLDLMDEPLEEAPGQSLATGQPPEFFAGL